MLSHALQDVSEYVCIKYLNLCTLGRKIIYLLNISNIYCTIVKWIIGIEKLRVTNMHIVWLSVFGSWNEGLMWPGTKILKPSIIRLFLDYVHLLVLYVKNRYAVQLYISVWVHPNILLSSPHYSTLCPTFTSKMSEPPMWGERFHGFE